MGVSKKYKSVDELPSLDEKVYKVDSKTKEVTEYGNVDELPDLFSEEEPQPTQRDLQMATEKVGTTAVEPLPKKGIEPPIVEEEETVELGTPLDLIYKSKELGEKQIRTDAQGGAAGQINTPTYAEDKVAKEQSKKIKKQLYDVGIDADKIYNLIEGAEFSDESKANINKMLQENPKKAERVLANKTWKTPIKNKLSAELQKYTELGDANKVAELQNDLSVIDGTPQGTTYEENRNFIKTLAPTIRKYSDNPEKDIQKLATETRIVYGSQLLFNKDIASEDRKAIGLNDNQSVALDYLEDVNPSLYQAYRGVLTPITKEYANDYEFQLGREEKLKRLEEIGLQLKNDAAVEELNNSLQSTEPDALEYYDTIKTKLDEIETESGLLQEKYTRSELNDRELFADELLGFDNTFLGRAANVLGKATYGTIRSAYDIATAPFMSDEQSQRHLMKILGEEKLGRQMTNLPQSEQMIQSFKPKLSDKLKSEIEIIKQSKLSDKDKRDKVLDLLRDNPKEWERQPIDPTSNVSMKSMLYGVSDLAATLVPFIAGNIALGGGASASGFRKFVGEFGAAAMTMYNDALAAAQEQGSPNPYATAFRNTAINAFTMAGAGTASQIRKMALGSKNVAIRDMIGKMTDDEITKALRYAPKEMGRMQKAIQGAKNLAELTKNSVATAARVTPLMMSGGIINQAIDNGEIDGGHTVKEIALETLKFSVFNMLVGGRALMNKPNEITKTALFEAAANPTEFRRILDTKLENRSIDKTEYDQINNNISNAESILKTTPLVNGKGQPLNNKDARDLLFLRLQEKDLTDVLSKNIPKELADKVGKRIEDIQTDIDKVYKGTYLEKVDTKKLPKLSEPIEGLDEQGIPIGDNVPPPTGQQSGNGISPLTKEAEDLLASIGEGSKPTFITKNLEKIANDNGIEVTGKMSADDVINALKEKQQSGKDVVVDKASNVGGDVVDEKVVKSRVKRIAKSLNVDEQRSQQIHDIALRAKDYEDFKNQVGDLIGDNAVNENRVAETYTDIREEAKSEYEKELERNLEDLRASYGEAQRADTGLKKITEKSPTSVRNFINRILNGTTPETVAQAKARLVEMQRKYRKEKADMRAMLPRERGVNFVIEKLSKAARNGDISQEGADLAIDLIRKQPNMFEDLAISITKGDKDLNGDGVQGWYRAADALIKIFKNPKDPLTATHEILHHTERFLPQDVRDGITQEWHRQIQRQAADIAKRLKTETDVDTRQQLTQGLLYLSLAEARQIEPNSSNVEAMERIMSKYLGDHTDSKGNFHKGLGYSWYQLYNPSEWWAVNASKIFRDAQNKPELKTWVDKAKAFYNYLIDSAKKIFKGNPTANVEKGLRTILKGEALEDREGTMLSQSKRLLNIKQKGSFEDRLKSIYDEVNKGKAVEQSLKETTKAETTPTTSNQSEIETKKADIERRRQGLNGVEEIIFSNPNFRLEGFEIDGNYWNVVTSTDRAKVLVNVNGVIVPFYLTTGQAGKGLIPGWYPFFGIGKDGWLNKTDKSDMETYYERYWGKETANIVKSISEELNSFYGTDPTNFKNDGDPNATSRPLTTLADKVEDYINSKLNYTPAINNGDARKTLRSNVEQLGKEINAKYDAELKALEQSLKEQPKENINDVGKGTADVTTTILNKDSAKEYTTKSGRQKVVFKDGELEVLDIKTNAKVSDKTKRKAVKEYAENFDFTVGKKSGEIPQEVRTDEEAKTEMVKQSENPFELAEIYVNEEPTTQPLSTTERMIADYGLGKVKLSGYQRFGDRNKMTMGKAKSYISKEGGDIDSIAKEMSDYYEVEITPLDIVEFMDRFPNGVAEALKKVESNVAIEAAYKFQQLTGLKLNKEIAEKAINQQFEKLNQEQQKLIQQDYETAKQLEDAYWAEYAKTDGFTKESIDNKIEPTKSTQEVANEKEAKEPTIKANEAKENIQESIEEAIKYIKTNFGDNWNDNLEQPLRDKFNSIKKDISDLETEYYTAIKGKRGLAKENAISKFKENLSEAQLKELDSIIKTDNELNESKIDFSFLGLQEVANEFGLTDITSRERKSDVDLFSEAKDMVTDWVKKGTYEKNISKIVIKGEEKGAISDIENVILGQHISTLRTELNNLSDINSAEYGKKLNELDRLLKAANTIRSTQGAALRVPILGIKPRYDLPDMLIRKKEALNVSELTEEQTLEIQKEYEDIKKRAEIAEAKNIELEKKIAEYKANQAIKAEKKQSNTPKTKDDFVKERQSLKEKLKKQLQEYKENLLNVGIIADGEKDFIMTTKIAKTISDIVKSHVEEVGQNLAEVTKKVIDEVKDVLVGITEKDIHEVMAGKYNEKKPTKTKLELDLAALKKEVKLIDELDKLQSGQIPNNKKQRLKTSQKIKDIQDQIKDFKKSEGLDDRQKLINLKKRNEDKIQKINEKIANKDFEETPKSESILDNYSISKKFPKEFNEAMDSQIAKEEAEHKYEVELLKDLKSRQNLKDKTIDFVKVSINTITAIKSGIDDSFMFIQGLPILASNWYQGMKAISSQWKDFFSEKRFRREIEAVHNNKPLWDLIQKSGLDYLDPKSLREGNRDEILGKRNWLNSTYKVGNTTFKLDKYTTAPFERLYTSLGNNLRLNVFVEKVNELQKEGKTFESHPQLYKDLGRIINEMSGRGKLHKKLEPATDFISMAIWSPKLLSSTLNILGLGDALNSVNKKGEKGYYTNLSPEMRKFAIANTVKAFGTLFGVMFLWALNDDKEVDLDPSSVTFGQVKDKVSGNSYNILGRFTSVARILAMLSMGKKTIDGQEIELDKSRFGASRGNEIWRFTRGKFNPVAGEVSDFITQKTFDNKQYTVDNAAERLLVPMSVIEISKGLEQQGYASILKRGIPSFVGVKVSNTQDFMEQDLKEKEWKFLADNGLRISDIEKSTLKIKKNGKEEEVNTEQYNAFMKEREDKIKSKISTLLKKGLIFIKDGKRKDYKNINSIPSDIKKEVIKKAVLQIQRKATEQAKLEVLQGGVKEKKDKVEIILNDQK